MKKITAQNILIAFLLLFSFFSLAENTPAFPGAEGFGRYTTGGRGGTVYHVTSLADDGSTGTFRWAMEQGGKRTIVFDVSGTVHLTSALALRNGNITIAGQTAPGDGICIADYPFTINASNVIIRFIRFRLGNKFVAYHEGDGLGGMDQQNIMVDHCSISWSIDECCSVYGNKNMTLQWCIVSQSLRNSGHEKGAHGYGGNWGGSGASYHHNLLAHHDSRTPRLGPRASTQTDERMDYRNNVIYNWGGNGCYGGEGMNVNIVNNYYKPGPGTNTRSTSIRYRIAAIGIRTSSYVATYTAFAPMLHVWGDYYVTGNKMNGYSDVTADNWTKGIYEQITNSSVDNTFTSTTKDTMKIDSPIEYVYTTTQSPEIAYEKVLQYAGASHSRDWVDSLMVSDTRNGFATYTGSGSGDISGIIDSQDDNKPANAPSDWDAWPTLQSTTPLTDTDKDGIPDAWESANGLNPSLASDANTYNLDGYTMLEVYMNSLVANIMTNENEGGVVSGYTEGSTNSDYKLISLYQQTYIGSSGASSPWLFDGGYNISNGNGKTYTTGSELGVKYSSGVKFTVNLPNGATVDSVKFSGYDNYSGADSYLSELNGTTYSATDYVYTQKEANGNYVLGSHTIPFATPVAGSFSFTFGGNQVVMSIELSVKTATGIKNYSVLPLDPNKLVNVYTIDGRILKSNVLRREATNHLLNGIYIIDGQKIMINNRY
ncbi:MAG: pectate lyase [Paludibacter sp.]|nr:pectate lyase [Paludibacter sp.]